MTVGSSGLWVRFLVHMTPPLSDIRTIFDDISDVFIEDVFRPATGIMNLLDPPQSGGLAAPHALARSAREPGGQRSDRDEFAQGDVPHDIQRHRMVDRRGISTGCPAMSADSLLGASAGIYTALTGDGTLMAMITGVHDHVPQETAFPYVTIGEASAVAWRTVGADGMEVTLVMHAWSRSRGHREVKQIMAEIHRILHEANLTVPGHVLGLAALRVLAGDRRQRRRHLPRHRAVQGAYIRGVTGTAAGSPAGAVSIWTRAGFRAMNHDDTDARRKPSRS